MRRVLLDAVTTTNATKQEFTLTNDDFIGDPALKSRGLGTGDVVSIWEYVNGDWQDTGQVLDEATTSIAVNSLGTYAVTVVMTTAGPASVEIQASGRV